MPPKATAAPSGTPTSLEVARRAGVSRTTVSFVLNGVRDQAISEPTRARVLAAAREMGYAPHAAARMLASGQSGTVALVIPKTAHLYTDAFLAQLFASINEQCHRHGLRLLVESTDDEGREAGDFVKLVRSRRIDGLIVVNLRTSEHEHVQRVCDAGIPIVVFGLGPADLPRSCTMGTDNTVGARTAVQHLISLGHERVAYLSFAPDEFHSVSRREQGWREALEAAGLRAEPGLVEHGDISAHSGYLAAQRLLARGQRFSALFAGNDTIAFGALKALAERGLRVPDDVALVGYDDIPLAAFASPPLTTMSSDPIGHGQDAMRLLLAQLEGRRDAAGLHEHRETTLVVRQSCGASRGRG